jgi:hypothetical protein
MNKSRTTTFPVPVRSGLVFNLDAAPAANVLQARVLGIPDDLDRLGPLPLYPFQPAQLLRHAVQVSPNICGFAKRFFCETS